MWFCRPTAMPSAGNVGKFQVRFLDAKQLGFEERVSAVVPDRRNKFHGMKEPNFRQGEIGRQNEIARRSDVQRHRSRLRSDRHFHRAARHRATAGRLLPVWFCRSVAAGMMRAIRHVRHHVRLTPFD